LQERFSLAVHGIGFRRLIRKVASSSNSSSRMSRAPTLSIALRLNPSDSS